MIHYVTSILNPSAKMYLVLFNMEIQAWPKCQFKHDQNTEMLKSFWKLYPTIIIAKDALIFTLLWS